MTLIAKLRNQIRAALRPTLQEEFQHMQKLANRQGMTPVQFYLHAPSRFHPVSPFYDGSSYADSEQFLQKLFGHIFKDARQWDIEWMGFRMIEPDLDGAARFRVIAWIEPSRLGHVQSILRSNVRYQCKDDRCLSYHGPIQGDVTKQAGTHLRFQKAAFPVVAPRLRWNDRVNLVFAVLTGRAA